MPRLIKEKKKWERNNGEKIILIWTFDGLGSHRVDGDMEAELALNWIFQLIFKPDFRQNPYTNTVKFPTVTSPGRNSPVAANRYYYSLQGNPGRNRPVAGFY